MDNSMQVNKVQCFGVREEYVRNIGVVKPITVYKDDNQTLVTEERMTVEMFNLVSNQWETYEMEESDAICPVCGRYMVVQHVKGVTWFAVCNPGCGEYFKATMTQNNMTPEEAMSYFINERLKERRGAG